MSSIYLYCLADPASVTAVNQLSQPEGGRSDEMLQLQTLEWAGIVAVIGEVDASEFNEQNLQSVEWIGPRAFRHAAVVEKIMASSTVLPVKFGAIFDSKESLTQFLIRHETAIVAFLKKLRGKSEWVLKGYLDEERARQRISAENSDIHARLVALTSVPPGTRYLQQKQVDAMIDTALRTQVRHQAERINAVLQDCAVETAPLRLLSEITSQDPNRAVFDCSFLVADLALPVFRAAFSDVHETGLTFGLVLELKGPLPPYSFCPNLTTGSTDANGA